MAVSRAIKVSQSGQRFVYGSDYPIPAFNALVDINALVNDGYLGAAVGVHLKQVYRYNPLLFSLLLNMSLKDPGTGLAYKKNLFRKEP